MALVFSDMDGTFLADDKSIPERNLEALEYLRSVGCGFVPCTGRIGAGVGARMREHATVTHVVSSNGARVWEKSADGWKSVYAKCLSAEQVLWVMDVLTKFDLLLEVFSAEEIYDSHAGLARVEEFYPSKGMWGYVRSTRTGVDDLRATVLSGIEIDRINVRTRFEDVDAVVATLSSNLELTVVRADVNGIDITVKGVNKGAALRALAELTGTPVEKCMAFGDGGNDIEMLMAAGCGVAMSNAFDKVKACADDVALSCNEAGVGEYIFSHTEFFE